VDHSEYQHLIEEVEALPKVKKVFIRSGIRFDYLLLDRNEKFFKKLVRDNVSGQLKVAPEHCAHGVLSAMGKPDIHVYEGFRKEFFRLCDKAGLEQYLVPYLMSSHPGSTMEEAVKLAVWLKKSGYAPEQVQDFYPTPGTVSTVMYYTGLDPLSGKKIYVATDYKEKQMQRALLQYSKPQNAHLVREALRYAHREDLIGDRPECLVRAAREEQAPRRRPAAPKREKSFGGRYVDKKKQNGQAERKSRIPTGPKSAKGAKATASERKGKKGKRS
jgi:radical SAM superfamily enzyme YgiQ (UPF0313 family)